MTVIWGLDMSQVQMWKFKPSYMFSKQYYLRREKMVLYQLAMTLWTCTQAVSTASLIVYLQQHHTIMKMDPQASVDDSHFVAIAAFHIAIGVVVSFLFFFAFALDLFWPDRRESRAVRLSWKIGAAVVVLGSIADSIVYTDVIARRGTVISGVSPQVQQMLLTQHWKANPVYRKNSNLIAADVLLLLSLVATIPSVAILILSQRHESIAVRRTVSKQSEEEDEKPALTLGPKEDVVR